MSRSVPRAGLGMALVILVTACGQQAPASPAESPEADAGALSPTPSQSPSAEPTATAGEETADLPAGWRVQEQTEAGFAIGLPPGWIVLDAETITDSAAFAALGAQNPDLAALLEQVAVSISSGQLALFAFDPSSVTAAGLPTHLNVVRISDEPSPETVSEAIDRVRGEIVGSIPGAADVEVEQTTLPGGEAVLATYAWDVVGATGTEQNVSVTQYLVLTDEGQFILSMTTTSDTAADLADTFEQVAESFSLE